ncbi:MAG: glycosyltransferase family 87 protein [Thermoleophilia bacterium]
MAIAGPVLFPERAAAQSAGFSATDTSANTTDNVPLLPGFPKHTEDEIRDIASRPTSIADILKKHEELERHVSFESVRGIWTVFWTLPANYHRLISVDISDGSGAIMHTNVASEAYFDYIPSMNEQDAIDLARSDPKVMAELQDRQTNDSATFGNNMIWTVSFYDGKNEVAQVLVDDGSGLIDEVMTGPQVAWQMARGYRGAFGRIINEPYVWLPLCLLFLAPFVRLRRPWCLLNLDLLVLLSFSISHYYFNQGQIFTSVPLVYPPLAYLFLRLGTIAVRRVERRPSKWKPEVGEERNETLEPQTSGRSVPGIIAPHLNFRPLILILLLIALISFRLIINIADSNVVDVGYSGVIGAHRILEGETPYGHMPADDGNGDTYGPANYLLYVPFERVMNWSGHWDDLPAAHAVAICFDLLAIAGMFMAGRQLARDRAAGNRLGLALAYGWVSYPYTTFVLNCNVNDSIVAALLIWGFVLLKRAPLAGAFLGLATMTKFFPAVLGPLWSSYPASWRGWGKRVLFLAGFIVAVAVTLPVIFMGDGTFATFWDRSVVWQIGRDSPFSIWGQYPHRFAGIQHVGQYVLVALACLSFLWPAHKTLRQVAAGSAALLVGFQMLQTHWFYLYIPWFFPLAFIAMLVRDGRPGERRSGFVGLAQ